MIYIQKVLSAPAVALLVGMIAAVVTVLRCAGVAPGRSHPGLVGRTPYTTAEMVGELRGYWLGYHRAFRGHTSPRADLALAGTLMMLPAAAFLYLRLGCC